MDPLKGTPDNPVSDPRSSIDPPDTLPEEAPADPESPPRTDRSRTACPVSGFR